MMFISLNFVPVGTVLATAEGHPDQVVKAFRDVCAILLGDLGPWRITKVHGVCPDELLHDSQMRWDLEAKVKSSTVRRVVL